VALISIPNSVLTSINQAMSSILSPVGGLGQNCVLYLPPIEEYCQNCFTSDSVVISEFGPKKISEVKPGDYVYNNNGLRRVEGVFNAFYTGYLYNFKVWGISDNWWCTSDHKFPIIKEFRKRFTQHQWYDSNFILENYKIEKVPAKEIKLGDGLFLGNSYNFSNNDLQYIDDIGFGRILIDDDLLYFIGWWLAEGHLNKSGRTCSFCLCQSKELNIANQLLDIGKRKFNLNGKLEFRKNADNLLVNFHSTKLWHYLKQFGSLAINKSISEYLFNNLSKNQLSKLFYYYYLGDGHLSNRIQDSEYNRKSIATISYKLAHQIFIFLQNIGFTPSIIYGKARINKWANHKEYWVVQWKEDRVQQKSGVRLTKDGMVSYVKEVKIKNGKEIVYNLSVDNEHNYLMSNILTGNCKPDPIGHKSSNIYVQGGPAPFETGQVCLYCGGNYYLAIEKTENIIMTINWEPSRWDPTLPQGHRLSNGTIQTRGNAVDLQKVNNCEFMETFTNTGYAHYRYKLMGEPTLSAQTSDLFFWAWWDRA